MVAARPRGRIGGMEAKAARRGSESQQSKDRVFTTLRQDR